MQFDDLRCVSLVLEYIMYLLAAAYLLWAWQPFTVGRKYMKGLINGKVTESYDKTSLSQNKGPILYLVFSS